ncbi:MAG TPA: hypothetical protein VFU43_09960, partial [Streptosporangiaceae bacterium]|nr:hypothetical protein [Streptosporangiaceae bacterium]
MNEIHQPVRQPALSSAITIPRVVAVCVLVFGLTALAVRCVAVASQSAGEHGGSGGTAAHAGPPLTLEQLAAKADCTPKIQTNAAELRQGHCTTSAGRFFLTTFATTQGQQKWLEQAQDYGQLLVGNRWVATGSAKTLQP